MSYSQALEAQLRLHREWDSPAVWAIDPSGLNPIADHLRLAETYYWSPETASTLGSVAKDMPRNWRLLPEMCPSQAGFWWLAKPIALDVEGTSTQPIRAISWGMERYRGKTDYLLIETWAEIRPGILDIAGRGVLLSGAHPDGEGKDHEATLATGIAISAAGEGDTDSDHAAVLLTAAGLAFLDQRILVAPQERIDRHTRKRLEREGYQCEPLVRVVELRRKQAKSEHHGESDPVEWSHRWIVSGHWRQQWYPRLNANQPIWVMPYVKGPEDKPLKPPRAKVFAVVR